MSKGKTILILDSLSERAQQLEIIFGFCGIKVLIADPNNLSNHLPSKLSILAVIIGKVEKSSFGELVKQVNELDANIPIVALDQQQSLDHSQVVAELDWPFKQNELLACIHACQTCTEYVVANGTIDKSKSLSRGMVGQSKTMAETRRLIQQVAGSDASVLILGESGTGKEIAARNLHDLSERSNKPFVPINCGAIPAELLESELFGHEKGAFTGALIARKGRFELAEGGTIFLDEIGDMPMPMQVKLLRVLQERTFERVGSSTSIVANVRIIAATHRNLATEVQENRFREDLFYRLNVFPIEMPSLRERAEDIGSLANELVARLEKENRGSVRLSPNAIESLKQSSWPGNVRELANLMERLCILFPYGVVDVKDLPTEYQAGENSYSTPKLAEQAQSRAVEHSEALQTNDANSVTLGTGVNLKQFLMELEIRYIEQALEEEGGVVARAAKRLTMQRTTLVEKMRKYGLPKT